MRNRLSSALWVLWMCARMQMREMSGHQLGIVIGFVQPAVLILVTTGGRSGLEPAESTRLLVAVVLTSLWNGTVWMAGGILQRELQLGTLAANVAAVHPGFLVLLGKSLGATTRTVASILVASSVTIALVRAPVRLHDPVLLVVGLLTVILSGTALGMLLASLFLLTRYGSELSNALLYPIFILGGLLIPLSLLPGPLRVVADFISLRWAQSFLISAAGGQASARDYLLLLVFTAAYFVIGVLTFNRVVDRARRGGTLELL